MTSYGRFQGVARIESLAQQDARHQALIESARTKGDRPAQGRG